VRIIDTSGKEHSPLTQISNERDNEIELQTPFSVPLEQIRQVKFMVRALDKWTCFENVTLDPTAKAGFRVRTGNDPTTMPGR
jgi:hypothetical protein